ncbi:hypothetical protein CSB66_4479 [Enterobacter hormaechei]|nr:hypothetical protein CSC02_3366 [Enterobacter hormaechei subsp. hoffmannii]AWF29020.1 hypothetical protein CSC19_2499 [Enterobacter hormaechei]AWZ97225.1 hypothetical protein CSB67_1560 [Enterobacter hormaechei]RCG83588.1 hypothetical protein CSB66_4479 [Enterobacter hormaechei]
MQEFSLFHGLNVIYSLESSKSSLRLKNPADSRFMTFIDVSKP